MRLGGVVLYGLPQRIAVQLHAGDAQLLVVVRPAAQHDGKGIDRRIKRLEALPQLWQPVHPQNLAVVAVGGRQRQKVLQKLAEKFGAPRHLQPPRLDGLCKLRHKDEGVVVAFTCQMRAAARPAGRPFVVALVVSGQLDGGRGPWAYLGLAALAVETPWFALRPDLGGHFGR